jgi:hypothetical protein
MKQVFLHRHFFYRTVFCLVCCLVIFGCEPDKEVGHTRNRPPEVRIIKDMYSDSSQTTLLTGTGSATSVATIHWFANDADGFITGYMYRWSYKDSANGSVVYSHPWTIILDYITSKRSPLSYNTSSGYILMLDIQDTSEVRKLVPEVYKYFRNAELYPDYFNPSSDQFDSSLYHLYLDLDRGKTRIVKGVPVRASNPYNNKYPVHESPYKGTFVFESPDTLNWHKFEILAIDNQGLVSTKPDTLVLWTGQGEPVYVYFPNDPSNPYSSDSLFILPHLTPTWSGIRFNFIAGGINWNKMFYSVRVDSFRWTEWSENRYAVITGENMNPARPLTGRHTIEVRAKDDCGAITKPDTSSTPRDKRMFYTIYPAFTEPDYQKRILLAVHVKENQETQPWFPSNTQIEQYYSEIYDSLGYKGKYDVWNARLLGMPSCSVMGHYTTIHIIDDVGPLIGTNMNARILGVMYGKYLDIGGNIIMNGLPDLAPSRMVQNPESLLVKRMHILGTNGMLTYCTFITNPQNDFIGAFGNTALGYPAYIELDSTKLNPSPGPYCGGLPNIAVSFPSGFAETIFSYDSKSDTTILSDQACDSIKFQGHSMGYLYRGPTYQTAYYGFPLWFVKKHQATAIIRRTYELFYP